jgi:hypothetical protein
VIVLKGKYYHSEGEYTEEGIIIFADAKCNLTAV